MSGQRLVEVEEAFAEAALVALRNAHTWTDRVRAILRVFHEYREDLCLDD